jgi:hypothetical protein
MKAGDSSKLQALQSKSTELQTEATQMAGKVKSDEAGRFSAFISECAQKITSAAQSQGYPTDLSTSARVGSSF